MARHRPHRSGTRSDAHQRRLFGGQYQRLLPRRGHGRALGAVKNSILCACWHMLTTGELYRELGGDYFSGQDPERATQRLIGQLERPGHRVTLEAAA